MNCVIIVTREIMCYNHLSIKLCNTKLLNKYVARQLANCTSSWHKGAGVKVALAKIKIDKILYAIL